jgi:hypothetical protein
MGSNSSKIGEFELNRISANRNNRKAYDELTENINIPDEPKIMKKLEVMILEKLLRIEMIERFLMN